AGDTYVETTEASTEQEDPVEDGRGKGVDVLRHRPQPDRAAQHPRQVAARGAALGPAHQQEIQVDRIQAEAADAAPAMAGDAADQPDRETAAALGTLLPVRTHAVATIMARPAARRRFRRWPAGLPRATPGSASAAIAPAAPPL